MSREPEFDVMDTSQREAKHQTGGRASLNLPPGLSMFRPKKKGVHTLDIIAFQVSDAILKLHDAIRYAHPGKWYGEQTFYTHGGVGVNNESFTCPAMTFNKPCPICNDSNTMRRSNDQAARDRGYELKAKERQLFLVFDHDDAGAGIQLWELAYWNFGKQLDAFIEASRPEMKSQYKLYYHPTAGYTLRIAGQEQPMGQKRGAAGGSPAGGMGGTNTIYAVNEMYPRPRPIPVEMFRHGFDLTAMIRCLDFDALRRVYEGRTEGEADPPAGVNASYGAQTQAVPNGAPSDRGGGDPYAALFGGAGAQPAPPVQYHPNLPTQDGRGFPVYTQPGLAPATPLSTGAWDDGPASGAASEGDDEYYADDEVEFEYRGQRMTGTVESVDTGRRVVRVQIPGESALRTVMFEDAKLVTQAGSAPPPTPSQVVNDFAPPPRRAVTPVVPPPPVAPPVDDAAPPPRRRGGTVSATPAPVVAPEPTAPPPRTRTRQPAPAESTDDNPPAPRRRK